MTTEQLNRLLRKHILWLKGYKCGKRLDLSNMDLSGMDLSNMNLQRANLQGIDLREANLENANLKSVNLKYAILNKAILYKANLENSNLEGAKLKSLDLRFANLSKTYLKNTNLKGSDLRFTDLRSANLCKAILKDVVLYDSNLKSVNLSGARGLLSPIDYLEKYFEKTKDGYIAYKSFGLHCNIPNYWKIEENSIIKENVDTDRSIYGSYGINAGTLEYVRNQMGPIISPIHALLIKYEWLAGVVVPYNSNGLIRCERAMILNKVN